MEGGLRERKKQRTRREISDVATRLFLEHGFERVTLAEIADAAEVSVKTIFNHFGSKEDLFFDRIGELRDGIEATMTGRPPGVTVVEALRRLSVENVVPFPGRGWGGFDAPEDVACFRGFVLAQHESPALRARRMTLGAELHEHLRAVLAGELGRPVRDPVVRSMAAMLGAASQLRDEVLREALAQDLPMPKVRRRVVTAMNETYGRIAAAYADVDRPG
jgi:AcrR family transcriptional regulator